ncbi:hypothetical protein KDW99_13575 [Marinomonas rhizomae]|uniref:hypothetical protein n=1 Tax=Marinomonas rhizomae TaxID=491948 RepID=UPI002101FDCE|nr:hypothetical protein [Marinomonas rhizomae]UTV98291.1 hypothetical protein KDW99_13575 [Marinomonas rhizomae]
MGLFFGSIRTPCIPDLLFRSTDIEENVYHDNFDVKTSDDRNAAIHRDQFPFCEYSGG